MEEFPKPLSRSMKIFPIYSRQIMKFIFNSNFANCLKLSLELVKNKTFWPWKEKIFLEGEISRYQGNAGEAGPAGDGKKPFDGCENICGGKNAAVEDFIGKGRDLFEFVNSLPTEFQTTKLDKIKKVGFSKNFEIKANLF